MLRGRFITLEGGEGAGKSTQVRLLAAALTAAGIETVATREPGGAPGAERIRGLLVQGEAADWDPLSEALLHYAARREHLRLTVAPALERGAWVVCDRFADSTTAYQSFGQGVPRAAIESLYRLIVGDAGPDLTLVMDLPVEVGLARASARPGMEHRYERMDRAFHERMRQGFLEIARAEPDRCVVLDAGGSPEEVHAAIRAAVSRRLGAPL